MLQLDVKVDATETEAVAEHDLDVKVDASETKSVAKHEEVVFVNLIEGCDVLVGQETKIPAR